MAEWQARWDGYEQSRLTRRLIDDLRLWTGRGFGEGNFYLNQLLSGHGYFRRYLHRIGRLTDPICRYCGHDGDDAEHTDGPYENKYAHKGLNEEKYTSSRLVQRAALKRKKGTARGA